MLRALAAAIPLAALHEVFLAGTRGFGTMRPTIMVERVFRPVLQPIAIVGVGLAGAEAGALALAWAAPYVAAVVLSGLALRRRVRAAAAPPTTTFEPVVADAGRATCRCRP